jgi:4-diphosphocytidyl-2-C-methyl-D-erythritol kinase
LKVEAPAKINLGLHVLRQRSDGFHEIETVMVRLGWFDTIEAKPAPDLSLTCSDPNVPAGNDNLCLKAAIALKLHFGVEDGAQLYLTKRIPSGAGLGGGSSDAASTLRVLSQLWHLSPRPGELEAIAAGLGSDVPFFLGPSPAIARGRGERITALAAEDGSAMHIPYSFVVVKPKPSVSTAEAYQWVTPSDEARINLVDLIRSCDIERWRRELTNDFESPVSSRVPEIDQARELLLRAGAGFAGMSGSGSAVFGVFKHREDAAAAQHLALSTGLVAWAGETT